MIKTHYPRLDETVYREVLANGLQVCVVKKPGFTRKCSYFVTDFGSIHQRFTLDGVTYDTPPGVAHYLEHKMFDLPGGRDINEEFAALGANPNAFTSYDMTAYYVSCTDRFEESLKLLLEFVSTPYFTQETVDKERGIIAQEILMYEDSPDSRVYEQTLKQLYAHHPLRIPIAGTVSSIEDITPELLETCYRAFYHPGNMMLCVVGDVDEERVCALAREMTPAEGGSLACGDLGRPEELTVNEAWTELEMDVAMPTFQMGIKCPPGKTGEELAHWELVAELACEGLMGESSQLYLELYEKGLIDSSFGWEVETISGSATILAGGDSEDPAAVRDAIFSRARHLAQEGISQEEFQRMIRSTLGRRVKDLDSFEATCFRLCAYHYEGFDYLRFPELLEQVRREELKTFWQEHFQPERCAVCVIYPRSGKEE